MDAEDFPISSPMKVISGKDPFNSSSDGSSSSSSLADAYVPIIRMKAQFSIDETSPRSLGKAAREYQEQQKIESHGGSSGGTKSKPVAQGHSQCAKCRKNIVEGSQQRLEFIFRPQQRTNEKYQKMFGKKSKSKHSQESSSNLMSTGEPSGASKGTGAKSDHGDKKKYGFFENFRRQIASFGRKDTRSQGMMDHID